jgi:hypothetical protein
VAYTQIVTISTGNILNTNEFRDSVSAQWSFLSDAGREIQKDLDIAEYIDPYYDPMIPHTLAMPPGLVLASTVALGAAGRAREGRGQCRGRRPATAAAEPSRWPALDGGGG